MSEDTLMSVLIFLLILLVPLLLSYWPYPDPKTPSAQEFTKKPQIQKSKALGKKGNPPTFKEISAVFTNKTSTKEELTEAIEELIRYHGKIHAKLGDLPHPDFKRYLRLIIELCNNPQTDKDIIVLFDQKLRVKNPRYAMDIDEATNKGIAGRGF
jgi:hypothetical protein